MAKKQKAPRRLRPFTVDHFRAYAGNLVLDTGQLWPPQDFQLAVAEDLFAGNLEVWMVLPEGNAKALDVATPLPTPDGWTSMLDTRVGDLLLDRAGNPVRVSAVSDVMLGRPCYEVIFSDGASLVADAEHLWKVEGAHDKYRPRILSTAALRRAGAEMSSGARRWRVPTGRRRGPDQRLPIDPYVLGAWLGDGAADCGRISVPDAYIWKRIRDAGYSLGKSGPKDRCRTHTVLGLKRQLRALGLLGAKRVPEEYLTASLKQRRALIQGMLDTDGGVSKAGQLVFSTANPDLRDDFRRLAWSLGRPCYVDEDEAELDGRPMGPYWRLTVACEASHKLVSLPRKAARLKPAAMTAEHRRIVSIEPVRSRPVKCVEVESADRLYLAGEAMIPTHNTTLLGGIALYHCDYTPGAEVVLGASSRDQCQWLLRQAAGFVNRTPAMRRRFKVQEGSRRIRSLRSGGRIQVFAADERTGDGAIFTLALLDELHRHRDLRLYRTWRGKARKRGGQLAAISTAGEPDTEFEQIREKLRSEATEITRSGAHTRAARSGLVLHDFSVPVGADIGDMKVVKEANPLPSITVKTLTEDFESPTMSKGHWRRMKCNQAIRGIESAVDEAEWTDAGVEGGRIPEGQSIWCGLDIGWKWDCTAWNPFWWEDHEHRHFGVPKILTPPRDGTSLDPKVVKQAFLDINKRNPVEVVVMDESRAEDIAGWLRDEFPQIRVVPYGQGNSMKAMAAERFLEALRQGWFSQPMDAEFTRHVMNAIERTLPDGRVRFDRKSSARNKDQQDQRVWDALDSASMVHASAVGEMTAGDQAPTHFLDFGMEMI